MFKKILVMMLAVSMLIGVVNINVFAKTDQCELYNGICVDNEQEEKEKQEIDQKKEESKTQYQTKKEERKMNWAASGINVSVNKQKVVFPDQQPLLDADTSRTYVPVRFLAESLGAEVDWDNEHQVVIIKNKYIEGDSGTIHYLKIGENKFVTVAHKYKTYEEASETPLEANVYYLPEGIEPVLVNARTMLPFRYVAEFLGSQVYYDPRDNTAHCVKRDMSKYATGKGIPIFSTIMEKAWIEAVNAERFATGISAYTNKWKATWNGTLADVDAWAAIDHILYPLGNTVKYADNNELHLFSDGSRGAVEGFANQGYLPIKYTSNYASYAEIAGQNASNDCPELSFGHNEKYWKEASVIYKELKNNWGIEIPLVEPYAYSSMEAVANNTPDPLKPYEEYSNICIYNDETYKDIATSAISKIKTSSGHYHILTGLSNEVGFAWVGKFRYSSLIKTN